MKIRGGFYVGLMALMLMCGRSACAEPAGALNVTEVHSASGTFTVTFNNAIEIRKIVLVSSGGITTPVLPRGITVLNDQTQTAITDAVTRGIVSKDPSSQISYTVGEIIPPTDAKKKAKATCVVTFNDSLTIATIIMNKDSKSRLRWPQGITFKNNLLKKTITKSVLGKYQSFFNRL